ncbi:FtsH protease regulator HflK [Planctomycetes bacterium Pan216]|uniref:FtsH protease regulator HflK n=1 Tax=Kolteria novifilia TaxID=2527975 RepID=A0A518BBD9_9BACT|nr:FtsH protease regulator HflK [Planctomycetes bacterium Pan216]
MTDATKGSPAPTPRKSSESRGVIVAVALTASIELVVAASAGITLELVSLVALALQAALVATAGWLTLDACSIRKKQFASETPDDDKEEPQASFEEARSMHAVFLAVPVAVVLFLASFQLYSHALTVGGRPMPGVPAAIALAGLLVFCVWRGLTRLIANPAESPLPEQRALLLAARESQVALLLTCLALFVSETWPALDQWVGMGVILWVLVTGAELLVRAVGLWSFPPSSDERFQSPTTLTTRELIFASRNPVASLFDTIERRWGVGLRSTWAVGFVRRAFVPLLGAIVLMTWLLTSLVVVEVNQLGVRLTLGRMEPRPLGPGMHLVLPWPFGSVLRVDVTEVRTLPIGYEPGEEAGPETGTRALLWTKAHAKSEDAFVLGDGIEVVAINALVYYRVSAEPDRFREFVYSYSDPTAALRDYAEQAVMEETRSATLAQVLSDDRKAFAKRIARRIARACRENAVGVDIVDVAIVNLHPPMTVAPDYLDVISGRLQATRAITEASGWASKTVEAARSERASAVAIAKIESERRVSEALVATSRLRALAEALAIDRAALSLRLWFDTLETALADKPLFLIETTLLQRQGSLLLDLNKPTSLPLEQVIAEPVQ